MPIAILAVEDDHAVQTSLRVMFRKWADLTLEVARDGVEAIEKLGARDYALVITDLRMPGLAGVALLEELQRHFPALPVVILSGAEGVTTEFEASQRGAVAFLRKPVPAAALRSAIANALGPLDMNRTPSEREG